MSAEESARVALDAYVAAVRAEDASESALASAQLDNERASQARQDSWRDVKKYVSDGTLAQGVYRVDDRTAIVISTGDYPPLKPLVELK